MRWLNPFVFGAWTFALTYLLVTRRYVAFLRPEFGSLLAFALIIAFGFAIAAVARNRAAEMDFPGISRALVLLLPIVYLMSLPVTVLGKNAFNTRYLGPANGTTGKQDQPRRSSGEKEETAGPPLQPDKGGGAMQASSREQTILEIFLNPMQYQNRRVIFSGMVVRDEKIRRYFGDKDTAVYRFLINCCAADAQPLAIAVDPDRVSAYANDQWVRVEGTFELRQINEKLVPVVDNAVIKPIAAPADPYLN